MEALKRRGRRSKTRRQSGRYVPNIRLWKKYGCRKVALVYPETEEFDKPLDYRFDEHLALTCFPFDVTNPECSVREIIQHLNN